MGTDLANVCLLRNDLNPCSQKLRSTSSQRAPTIDVAFLDRPAVHEAFIQFGLRAADYRVYVGRYVIMPDHIHVFAGFAAASMSLSSWVKSLKNTISKILINASFLGPHWQRGFFDHVIRSEESYEQKWLYVRDNPVRAGLVRTAEDWPFAGQITNENREKRRRLRSQAKSRRGRL